VVPPIQVLAPDSIAEDLVGPLHIGVEPAGSPLRGINGFGPVVVASDFGNNFGLLIGPEVKGWRELDWAELSVATLIDGAPASLSWLGGVAGHRVSPLGVDRFGQTGNLADLYRAYRLDVDAIVEAAAELFLK
jgi:hypothetical protein